jgi:hypothetical protein
MPVPALATFDRLFGRFRRRVHTRRALRATLTGLAIGSACGAAIAFALWMFGAAPPLPLAGGALALTGGIAGALRARRARWSDVDVALFLDARLASPETITSAVTLTGDDSARAENLRARAENLLRDADPERLRPRLLEPVHGVSVAGALLCGLFTVLPSPRVATAEPPKAKGTELVRKESVPGLERIEALERAEGLSDADAERLKKHARDAQQLRKDLASGLPKREALARVGRLRDDIAAERERFGDARERPGLEAAVNALSAEEGTRRAGKALEEGDVVGFDEEMQRLANQAEADARARAREALEQAQKAARAKRSQSLADMLERQRKLFDEREAADKALRELAKLVDKELDQKQREALKQFEQQGDPAAAEALAEALSDVLSELDEAERKQLLERLAKGLAESGEPGRPDPEQLSELGRRLSSAKGREELREALRQLARHPSLDAGRERALRDAERGGAEAERSLVPTPMPGIGPANPGGSTADSKPGAQGQPGGPGRGGAHADHQPKSTRPDPRLEADELRSKADTRLLPGAPLGTRALGRAPARAGETADQVGTGKLGSVGAEEVSAVENSDVPEEYREHVGRYFQP